MTMTDVKIRALKPRTVRYLTSDGRGLFLDVLPSGVQTWIFKYSLHGRQEKVTMGRYPDITLAGARKERDRLAQMVAAGKSPAQEKKLSRAGSTNPTMREFCHRYYSEQVERVQKSHLEVRRYIDTEICPVIGHQLLRDVAVLDLQRLIYRKRDKGRVTTALHLRGILKRIFDYALEVQLVTFNPAAMMATRYIGRGKKRERALSPAELRIVLRTVDQADILRQFKLAFRVILLTMVRKGELLQARWADVDLDAGTWLIPAEHTKMHKPHLVHLSTQVREMFRELKVLACGSELVLPGRNSLREPMCKNTLNHALARLDFGIPGFVIHDTRRTASTILHGNGFKPDVIEVALGHAIPGIRGIYNVAEYAAERRLMLKWWADRIDGIVTDSKVIVGNFA